MDEATPAKSGIANPVNEFHPLRHARVVLRDETIFQRSAYVAHVRVQIISCVVYLRPVHRGSQFDTFLNIEVAAAGHRMEERRDVMHLRCSFLFATEISFFY